LIFWPIKEHEIPEAALNEVLWKAIKGSVQMRSPRHCGFVQPDKSDEKDDDWPLVSVDLIGVSGDC